VSQFDPVIFLRAALRSLAGFTLRVHQVWGQQYWCLLSSITPR